LNQLILAAEVVALLCRLLQNRQCTHRRRISTGKSA